MAANWASALGAAILGGQQSFQRANEEQRRQEEFIAQKKLNALQLAITQHQVDEMPKKDAEQDMTKMLDLQGIHAYDDPSFLAKAQTAGMPIPTKDITKARVQDIESGAGTPSLSNDQMAAKLGVSPTTGAVISPKLQAENADQQRKQLMDQYQLDALRGFSNGGGYDIDPKTGLPANSPQNRAKEVLDPLKRITSMYGPATSMPSNIAADEAARANAKAQVPPAMMQRVVGGMNEMVGNLKTAQADLERMFPGIDQPDDPNKSAYQQPYNSPVDLAKAYALRKMYGFMDTPYNKAIQAASLGNVQGWATIVPGRINQAIIGKLSEHQSAFGHETPRATYMRNKELIQLLENNKNDLLTPMRELPPQAPTAPAPPPPGPLSVNAIEGRPEPQAVPPPQAHVAPPHVAAPPPSGGVKPGDTVTFDEIVRRTQGTHIDPKAMAAQLKAAGVNVVMGKPAVTPQAPPSARPGLGALQGATGLKAAPLPADWTVEKLLYNLGLYHP